MNANIINYYCDRVNRTIIDSNGTCAVMEHVSLNFHNLKPNSTENIYKLILSKNDHVVSVAETTTNKNVLNFDFKLNSIELAKEFHNHKLSKKLDFKLLIWNVTDEQLLLNNDILIQNNKFNYDQLSKKEVLFTPTIQYSLDGISWLSEKPSSINCHIRFSFDSGVSWTSSVFVAGVKGDTGAKGDAFKYANFTTEQLNTLKVKGDKGDTGAKGTTGNTGTKGDKGNTGAKGDKGDTGAKGDKGNTGERGALFYTDLTAEQKTEIAGVKIMPNLLRNGNFDIWQRGESFTSSNLPNGTVGADGWYVNYATNKCNNFSKLATGGMKVDFVATGGTFNNTLRQKLENAPNIATATIKFKGTNGLKIKLMYQNIASSITTYYGDVFTCDGSVQTLSATFEVPNGVSRKDLIIDFFDFQIGQKLEIYKTKLEEGRIFTGWTYPTYSSELLENQCYYQVIKKIFITRGNADGASNEGASNILFNNMRAIPTITMQKTAGTVVTAPVAVLGASINNIAIKPYSDWAINTWWAGNITLSAEL